MRQETPLKPQMFKEFYHVLSTGFGAPTSTPLNPQYGPRPLHILFPLLGTPSPNPTLPHPLVKLP